MPVRPGRAFAELPATGTPRASPGVRTGHTVCGTDSSWSTARWEYHRRVFRRTCCRLVLLTLALVAPATASQRYDQPAPGGRSPRNASYEIDVTLDHATRTLRGHERITWRNISAHPATELRFHLYWNAWRNADSTFMRERRRAGTGAAPARGEASVDVTRLRVGHGSNTDDLTARLAFIAPDDGNTGDRTAASVPLPTPVEPLDTVTIDIDWVARAPRTVARTG